MFEVLKNINPLDYGFDSVVIWGSKSTLDKIDAKPWLNKVHVPLLDRNLILRVFWQSFLLRRCIISSRCDGLFVPGGSSIVIYSPKIVMHQNLLPFEFLEIRRFGFSLQSVKFILLRLIQGFTLSRAEGVIFLSSYSKTKVSDVLGKIKGMTEIIPHGVNKRFLCFPRTPRALHEFNEKNPCKIIYVSIVDKYKHHSEVVEAVAKIRSLGIFVELYLIGPPSTAILDLEAAINKFDPSKSFIFYLGAVDYQNLQNHYAKADIAVFASSCEAFGQIVTESMVSGLPIACSNMSSMPEILGDAGIYFDPESPSEIADRILQLINSSSLRANLSTRAFNKVIANSWEVCASNTFGFIMEVIKKHKKQEENNE